jgi:NADH:ubiquinone reductase (H+-translocating)
MTHLTQNEQMKKVVIIGGGFAGLSCAKKLVNYPDIHITLIDKNNYHEFKPLLYQVSTSALSTENVASTFRSYFKGIKNIDIKMAEVISIDPGTRMVRTKEGENYYGDFLVIATGAVANFFDIPGAEQNTFPLYSLIDAERLRSRIIAAFEDVDRNPALIQEGALNFVVVGGGATGIEIAGSLADMFNHALPKEFSDLAVKQAAIYIIDRDEHILNGFSKRSQQYGTDILQKRGVKLKLGLSVKKVAEDHVLLSDESEIMTRTIIWAGGLKPGLLSASCGLPLGFGKRIDVQPDLTVEGFPQLFVIGDLANTLDSAGKYLPQLAAVAQQAGRCAAENIIAEMKGNKKESFRYKDKGIMAMIGRNAAVAEIGKQRRAHKGFFAFLAWLFVHAILLPTVRQRLAALFSWSWNYFGKMNELQILDNKDAARIKWDEEKH